MRRAPLSGAAAQLLRCLMARIGLDPDRILIGRFHSVDWQSLTFTGERHELSLRLVGPDSDQALARLRDGLGDAEWQLSGHVVADILIVGQEKSGDGSILVDLEALTLTD